MTMINMSDRGYKHQRRARARVTALVILIIIYLLGVTTYDAFIGTPKKNARIELVYNKFIDMKSYLDAKLPQIDSALIRHEIQLDDQNDQLLELNKLTGIIEEGNSE